eukprot:COSAG02_NODE_11745_length_1662_cov_11.658717_4_plen_58_part_01
MLVEVWSLLRRVVGFSLTMMVPSRCAIANTVHCAKTSRIMIWIFASVRTSTDAVHSSM